MLSFRMKIPRERQASSKWSHWSPTHQSGALSPGAVLILAPHGDAHKLEKIVNGTNRKQHHNYGL